MTSDEIEYVKAWLHKANEDIQVILKLTDNQPELFTGAICFHCQQAVEKFLKAYLSYNYIDYPKTHDLDYLLSECRKIDKKGFEDIDLKNLTDFGVSIRYPDDFYIPDLEEVNEYVAIAIKVKNIIDQKIVID